MALFCRADRANQCPKSGGERTQRGHSRFRSVRDRTHLISYIDASSLDGLAARQPRGHWRHTAIAGTIAEPPVRIAEFERPNDLPAFAASDR
jgi:hypothetical protein